MGRTKRELLSREAEEGEERMRREEKRKRTWSEYKLGTCTVRAYSEVKKSVF